MGTVIKNGIAITHLNPNAGGGTSLVKIKAVDAATTPAGVTWKQGQTTITGTLEASEATKDYIVFVPSSSKAKDLYDEYIVMEENGAYSWEKLGHDITIKEHPYISLERKREYLYRVTFDTLPQDNGVNNYVVGGCSSYVKDGKLYRNFDFNYSRLAEFIVRTKDFEGMSIVPGLEDASLDDAKISQLPFRPVDGRNNNGIMLSVHLLFNDWRYTGAGAKSIPLTRLPYEVLTKVKSMESIATDLAGVLGNLNAEGMGDYLIQLLITDGATTYALIPPTTEGENYELVDATEYPKMTNFRYVARGEVSRYDMDMQDSPTGIERFNAMPCKLEDLRFTKAYESADRLTEFIGINGTTKASTDAELEAVYELARAKYLTRTRNGETWHTMHSVVYGENMESLFIQENWNDECISGGSTEGIVRYDEPQTLTEAEQAQARNNINAPSKDGYYSDMTVGLAENFVPEIGDGGTLENGFLIRSSAEGESILGLSKILGLKGNVVGGVACTPTAYKKVIFNQINPAQVITSATINTSGKVVAGSHTVAFYRTPKCTAGDGANNGWVIEFSQAGASGTIFNVAHYVGQPTKGGAEVGTILEKEWHRNSQSYLNESAGWIAVEVDTITGLCAHIAWSGYMDGVYKAYEESIVNIPQFSKGWYGKVGRIFDEWDGAKLYNRIGKVANLATLTWDEEIVEIPPVEEGGDTTYQYIYTAPVADMLSGSEVDSDYAGLVADTTNLKVVSDTQLTPSTAFANKYCYYVLAVATEETGLVSTELICGDFGTEEITGTSVIPSGVTIKYDSNLRDKLRNMRAITESEIDEVFNEIYG